MLVILIIPLAMLTALALIDVYRKKGSWFLQLICLGILVFIRKRRKIPSFRPGI